MIDRDNGGYMQGENTNKQVIKEPIEPKPTEGQVGGSHYKKMKIQPMVYCMKNNFNFAQSTAIKYLSRYKDKNGIEDLRKAIHCIKLLAEIEYMEVI